METGVPPTLYQEARVDDDNAKDKVCINYLPREVIYDILLLIPAKLLHEVVRFVCKQWYDIVNDPFFVRAHCQMPNTPASYLIQSYLDPDNDAYCADQDGVKSVKVTKIRLPFLATIQGSCNGLILLSDDRDKRIVHVMNPVTKLIRLLPPIDPVVVPALGTSYCFAVNSSGRYKLGRLSFYDFRKGYNMFMFTIGVDKAWRRIDVRDHQGIPLTFRNTSHTVDRRGVFIAGFMYWCSLKAVSLAMDVDTETLYRISWPTDLNIKFYEGYFISTGTALGLLAVVDYKRRIYKLLRLTDVKSSEWTAEIEVIDIGAMIRKVSNGKWTYGYFPIYPVSLINGELCFKYDVNNTKSFWIIRYNLANESFVSFEVDMPCFCTSVFHHIPTLISL